LHFNQLGRTNLKVSEIGLGTEFLFRQPKETAKAVISKAIDCGINYFDVLFSVKHYLEKLAPILKEFRDQVIITGHIGTVENAEERPRKTRKIKECTTEFLKILKILKIDYVDVINIQFVRENEFEKIIQKGGLYDLAVSFIDQGKARFLGLSTHDIPVIKKAVHSNKFDTIMYPLNIANHRLEGRAEALALIKKNNIGLVAIKPFAAGNLLQYNRTVSFAKYQTGGLSFKKKNPPEISPIKCINYVKSIPEVSTVLMGVKNEEELKQNLKYSLLQEQAQDLTKLIEFY
jgi:predicted aldo/keto reductase-like oxidoreductase